MPKETFGGDDSGGDQADTKKKPNLDRFGLAPDINIRDLFWKIMASYAATRKPGVDLATLTHDRFTLMRIALTTLVNPNSGQYGPAPRFIATSTLMMLLDGGWKDAFIELLSEAYESKSDVRKDIATAMRKLLQQDYKAVITESLSSMLRAKETCGVALSYIPDIGDPELARALKKELVIIARGDVGANQLNAIKAITLINDDEDVRKSLIVLLSHWDAEARLAAAKALVGIKDAEVLAAVKRRLGSETDSEIKKILEGLADG